MTERDRVAERKSEREREWESEIVRVRKPLRTAKEPALVACTVLHLTPIPFRMRYTK